MSGAAPAVGTQIASTPGKAAGTRVYVKAGLRATDAKRVLTVRTNGARVKVRFHVGTSVRRLTLHPRKHRVTRALPAGATRVRVRALGGHGRQPSRWRKVRLRIAAPPVQTMPPRAGTQLPEGVAGSSSFPIGVWLESVTSAHDVALDKAAGINTYVGLTTTSDLSLATREGMAVLLQQNEWLSRRPAGHDGWVLADEIDMTQSPSDAFATLSDVLARLPKDGTLRYSNYGKGVAFWNTDAQAARFVNEFQSVTSVDTYWFTDGFICSATEGGRMFANGARALRQDECRRAANYGATVERVRALDARDSVISPVWNFVEVGHPFSEDEFPSIKPAEIRAAVWHSIIGGAHGIVYFNHSFGGPCLSQHALREKCYSDQRAVVTDTNKQIAELAPVINSPTYSSFVDVPGVKTLVKRHDGAWYIFAGSDGSTGTRTFQLPQVPDGPVAVVGENRSVSLVGNRFEDSFLSPNTVHIYRIPAA